MRLKISNNNNNISHVVNFINVLSMLFEKHISWNIVLIISLHTQYIYNMNMKSSTRKTTSALSK